MILLTSTAFGGEGSPILVNGYQIESIKPNETTRGSCIRMVGGERFVVAETVNAIMATDGFPCWKTPIGRSLHDPFFDPFPETVANCDDPAMPTKG